MTLHTLRHSFATHLLEQDTDVRDLIQVSARACQARRPPRSTRSVATDTIRAIDEPHRTCSPASLRCEPNRNSSRRHNCRRACPVLLWKSRTSSATSVLRGVRPTPAMRQAECRAREPRPVESDERHREPCRTAALGGHVARCQDCAYTTRRLQQLPQSALPQVSGRGSAPSGWQRARLSSSRSPYFHGRLHTAVGDWRHRLPEQGRRSMIILFKSRPTTMRTIAADPAHLGARIGITAVLAHLGLGHDASPTRAYDRVERRHLVRRITLGVLVGPSAFSCPCSVLSRLFQVYAGAAAALPTAAGRLRSSAATPHLDRRPSLRRLPGAAPRGRVGACLLRRAPFAGPAGRAGLPVALHPPRRHLQSPPDLGRPQTGVTLRVEGYRDRRLGAVSTMTLIHPPVHPAASSSTSCPGLPPHPPLRPASPAATCITNIAQRPQVSPCQSALRTCSTCCRERSTHRACCHVRRLCCRGRRRPDDHHRGPSRRGSSPRHRPPPLRRRCGSTSS